MAVLLDSDAPLQGQLPFRGEVRGHHRPPWDLGMAPLHLRLATRPPSEPQADYLHWASVLHGFLKDNVASDHFLKAFGSFLRSCQGRSGNPGRHVRHRVYLSSPVTGRGALGFKQKKQKIRKG